MGYTTEFKGKFSLNKKLDKETHDFLVGLATTRRMARKLPEKYGIEGEFYVDGKGFSFQEHDDSIINYNQPPKSQPSLWCQWIPTSDGLAIEWDGNEKFYSYVEWIEYIIKKILSPRGYALTGKVTWQGEEQPDRGIIEVKNNEITVKGNPYA